MGELCERAADEVVGAAATHSEGLGELGVRPVLVETQAAGLALVVGENGAVDVEQPLPAHDVDGRVPIEQNAGRAVMRRGCQGQSLHTVARPAPPLAWHHRPGMTPTPTVELAVRDHPGDLPAVVALHGLASNARWWDLVADRLANRLVAPDLRGHGLSPKPAGGYDFNAVTADVAALVDRLGLDRVLVAGHSWGASVALQLAADHPERVLACVCVDGGLGSLKARFPGGWSEAQVAMRPPDLVGVRAYQVRAWAGGALAEGSDASTAAEILLGNFELLHAADPEGPLRPRLRLESHMAIARALFELDGIELALRVHAPVVAVLAEGEASPWMDAKREAAAEAQALLGDRLRVVWVEGGHDLPVQRPDAVAREIAATLTA